VAKTGSFILVEASTVVAVVGDQFGRDVAVKVVTDAVVVSA